MVRWVFRPYTQIWRPNCTLGALRTSTRVSPGFVLSKYSSPSFGSSSIYSGFRPIPTLRRASNTHDHRACSSTAPRIFGNTDVSGQARAAGLLSKALALVFNFFANPSWFSFFTLSSHINETPWSVFQDGLIWPILTDLFLILPSLPRDAIGTECRCSAIVRWFGTTPRYNPTSRGSGALPQFRQPF